MSFGGQKTPAAQAAPPEQFSFKKAVAGYSGRNKATAAASMDSAQGVESILNEDTVGGNNANDKLGVV